ncbi:hypothetical protein PUNSTDRAFT_53020 [Punctularia strigosozonata HHB-11173 SS5]|uniref:uncharacterized protein n=1 Tax=Punctularia strigosozonata (strain HHB-11173) TaxID=741275 RepID=UPI0004416BAE|nr:uncharacterized protein PUNSTDRAFT_53020 [Punctularia strigosozonata HHB-11173 SS5]EIN07582.1 hypothetical protein PUNSTDRAFT_53020 [Punctularia strigosozonata HHB-11173 SS5]
MRHGRGVKELSHSLHAQEERLSCLLFIICLREGPNACVDLLDMPSGHGIKLYEAKFARPYRRSIHATAMRRYVQFR